MYTKPTDYPSTPRPTTSDFATLRRGVGWRTWLPGALVLCLLSSTALAVEQPEPIDPAELMEHLRVAHQQAVALMPRPEEPVLTAVYIGELFKIPEKDHEARPPGTYTDEEWRGIVFGHYYRLFTENIAMDGAITVVDQDGMGVPGVRVLADVLFNEPSLDRRLKQEESYQLERVRIAVGTDDEGVFSFKDWHVSSIRLIDVECETLIAHWDLVSASARSSRYADNLDQPARLDKTIKVWQLRPPDGDVVEHTFKGYLVPRENPHYFNLESGRLVDDPQEADIAIIYRIDMDAPGPVGRRPWTMDVRVLDGGIQASDMAYLFEAPADGYQPVFSRSHVDPRQTIGTPDFRLYVRHRDGAMHSAIEGRAGAWRDGRLQLSLNWRTNLEGGTMLQPPGEEPPE